MYADMLKAATTSTVAASTEELYQIQKLLTQHVGAGHVIALHLGRDGIGWRKLEKHLESRTKRTVLLPGRSCLFLACPRAVHHSILP